MHFWDTLTNRDALILSRMIKGKFLPFSLSLQHQQMTDPNTAMAIIPHITGKKKSAHAGIGDVILLTHPLLVHFCCRFSRYFMKWYEIHSQIARKEVYSGC